MGGSNSLPKTICVHGACCNSALTNSSEHNCSCCSCNTMTQKLNVPYVEEDLNYMEPSVPQSIRRRSSSVKSRSNYPTQLSSSTHYQMPTYIPKQFKGIQAQIEMEPEIPNICMQQMISNQGQEQRPETPVPVPVAALPTNYSNYNLQQIASILKSYQAKDKKIVMHPPQTLPVQSLKYLPTNAYQKENINSLVEALRNMSTTSRISLNSKHFKSSVPVM